MRSKKELQATAEKQLTENRVLRLLLTDLEEILNRPIENLAQAKQRIRRAQRKIAGTKEARS